MKRVFSVYTAQPYDVVSRYKDFSYEVPEQMLVVRSVQTGRVYCCLAESFVGKP